MPSEAGNLVGGRYRLAGPVGRGVTGLVWRARDELLDRQVAVKQVLLPSPDASGGERLLARAMGEARAAARLDHPGVITVYDVIEHEGAPWIVTGFVDGPSLGTEIARAPLPWRRAASIGAQVADALAHAHAAGLVHGDLKPANVLLAGPGGDRAVVTDFGLAGLRPSPARITGSAPQITDAGLPSGTLSYLAPEQLDDSQAGPPADLWALGALLYAAVAGRQPFTGASPAAIASAIRAGRLGPLPRGGPLTGLIGSLLAKDPAARPDAATAAAALAAAAVRPDAPTAPAVLGSSTDAAARADITARADANAGAGPDANPGAEPRPVAEPSGRGRGEPGDRNPAAATVASRRFSLADRMVAAVRANPRLVVGLATALAMILVLILVLTLFTPAKKTPAPSPGGQQTTGRGVPG